MTIQQISVFLENRAGQLAEITAILSEHQINMRALHIAETSDYGVLRMIVDQPQQAASLLAKESIDVEYVYSVFGQVDGQACMIFRVADAVGLASLLQANAMPPARGEALGVH